MAHGREEDGDPQLVSADVSGFLRDLRHPDGVAFRIKAVEGGAIRVELVAEDEEQVARAARYHGIG